jgi:hypothetical protein
MYMAALYSVISKWNSAIYPSEIYVCSQIFIVFSLVNSRARGTQEKGGAFELAETH